MNCQDFNDRLLETLDSDVQSAASEHLRQCGDCRQALLREKAVAESLRHTLERATAGLSLRPDVRRAIQQALKPAPPSAWVRAWRFISIPIRPSAAAATCMGLMILLAAILFYRRTTETPSPHANAQSSQETWVIDVPIQTQTHVFRRENNTVVDIVVPGAIVGHARFSEHKEPPSKRL